MHIIIYIYFINYNNLFAPYDQMRVRALSRTATVRRGACERVVAVLSKLNEFFLLFFIIKIFFIQHLAVRTATRAVLPPFVGPCSALHSAHTHSLSMRCNADPPEAQHRYSTISTHAAPSRQRFNQTRKTLRNHDPFFPSAIAGAQPRIQCLLPA